MNIFFSALLVVSPFLGLVFLKTPKVNTKDLQRLTRAQWAGTLTYSDYRTNKKVSIRSHLTVTQSAEDKLSWVFEYQYPDEPEADGKETVTISKDGTIIRGETVVERTNLAGDAVRIVAEKRGQDNEKNALFRFTYLLGPESFSIRKEVRYEGTAEFFERNQYSWKR